MRAEAGVAHAHASKLHLLKTTIQHMGWQACIPDGGQYEHAIKARRCSAMTRLMSVKRSSISWVASLLTCSKLICSCSTQRPQPHYVSIRRAKASLKLHARRAGLFTPCPLHA